MTFCSLGCSDRYISAPTIQSCAQVVGVHLQDVANILKCEQPRPIVRREPLLGLEETCLLPRVAGNRVLSITIHCVFKNSQHQPALAFDGAPTTKCRKVLIWKENIRFEKTCSCTAL